MSLIRKLGAALTSFLTMSPFARSQDDIDERIMLAVRSQYELFYYINNLPQTQSPDWERVEVLMDFESQPTKILSYIYSPNLRPKQISLSEVSSELWNNFFRGYTMQEILIPRQIQMTICRGISELFPLAVHYTTTTFGGRSLNMELTIEDHLAIATAMESNC
jgi:hypothetical protein